MDESEKIIASWKVNADAWIGTIENGELESRTLVTNKAIIDAILSYQPSSVLDIGCGEGWLTRTLHSNGIRAFGVDVVPELIAHAKAAGGDHFFVTSYGDLAAGNHQLPTPFDAVVINFALIDKEDTEAMIGSLTNLLTARGQLFVQTLHPFAVTGTDSRYETGWREGSWDGMKREFQLAYRWYFRTMENWLQLFMRAGFQLIDLKEPAHSIHGRPLSVIFILRTNP